MEKKRRGGQIIWVKENSILCLRENEKQSEILGELAENPSATATVAAVSATTKGNGVVPGTANANLDSMGFVGEIVDTRLDILIDLPGRVQECLLHILCRLRRRLHEHKTVLLRKPVSLIEGDLALVEVHLIADQHNNHVRIGI